MEPETESPLIFPNRVCVKHGAYYQDKLRSSHLWDGCGECENEQVEYENFESAFERYEIVVSDVEDATKGRVCVAKGDARVRRAFDLLNEVLGELLIKKNQLHSELIRA